MEPTSYVSATDIRNSISKKVRSSEDFRAGIIYSIYGQFPSPFSTVDLVILDGKGNMLLARKPAEPEWRFVGGFVDSTDDSDEFAARREGVEETGLELSDFKYVCSKRVVDWRYKNTERSVITHLFSCKYTFGTPTPQDDICELKWFSIERLPKLVDEHQILLNKYLNGSKEV